MKLYEKYKEVGIQTADRGKILLMLYEGAINFCQRAKEKIAQGDVGSKGIFIVKAQAIIHELMSSLNHSIAPELCASLESLYMYMSDRLSTANLNKDVGPIEEVIGLLSTLKDAWEQVINQTSESEEATARDTSQQNQKVRYNKVV